VPRSNTLLILAALPAPGLERYEAVEPAMGTLFRVIVYAESPPQARAGFDAAFARARELDGRLSDYRADSELNRLCRAGRAPVTEDLFAVLSRAIDIAKDSRGAFDPTLGPLSRLWRESRKSGRLPEKSALVEARKRTGWNKVRLDPKTRQVSLRMGDMQLDLGGIAKGYAADQMLLALRRLGLSHALVAASGDLALGDAPPGRSGWTLQAGGATHTLSNCGVSTSGPAEQFVEIAGTRYAHILDPRTGIGLVNAKTAAVTAPNATLADAIATAAVVMNPAEADRLARRWRATIIE
jgi:thiamine biosynthesis lipoprotein